MDFHTLSPPTTMAEIEGLARTYRRQTEECLAPIVLAHAPSLMQHSNNEYRKLLELSTKMMLVGHACTGIAGYPFDARRQRISSLFGACCFLADSFIDDFGQEAARSYLERFELLLTEGWFDVRNSREQLFYVILSRLFVERNVLHPMLRQAILCLFTAQKRDVELRDRISPLNGPLGRGQLNLLRRCTRDRGGHAITVLTLFLVPDLPLCYCHLIFLAGALIVFIDDHGDFHADRHHGRITYINQLRHPERALAKMYNRSISQLRGGLPAGQGRDLLEAFLFRYFVTRMKKHELERGSSASWAVYE